MIADNEALIRICRGVHGAEWRIKKVDGLIGRCEITLRGGLESEIVRDAGYLEKLFTELGEISVRLRRPAGGVLVGQILEAFGYTAQSAPTLLVETLVALLHGEGPPSEPPPLREPLCYTDWPKHAAQPEGEK